MTELTPFDDGYLEQEAAKLADAAKAAATAPPAQPAAERPARVRRSAAQPQAEPVERAGRGDRADLPFAEELSDDDVEEEREPLRHVEDGIYFGMAEEDYHSIERLSAGAVIKMRVSMATFWESSWMNPDREKKDKRKDDTAARIIGRAYHCARLEPHDFERRYCRALDRADYPTKGTVYTGSAIEAALAELGQPKTKSGERVIDKAERLRDAGYRGLIWPLVEAEWQESIGGRVPIAADVYDEIVRDMDRIKKSPEIIKHLQGGAAEVSIFWTRPDGLKCKARFDYLQPHEWADFKTFANPNGKHLFQAIHDAFRYNRYHVGGAWYRDASEAIRIGGLQVIGEAADHERELIDAIQLNPHPLHCWYIFQEKSGVPNLLARRFRFFDVPDNTTRQNVGAPEEAQARMNAATAQPTKLYYRGKAEIARALYEYSQYREIFGEDGEPWSLVFGITGDFEDEDFNNRWLEEIE